MTTPQRPLAAPPLPALPESLTIPLLPLLPMPSALTIPAPPGSSLWHSASQPPTPSMPHLDPPPLIKPPPPMPSTALSAPPPTAAKAALPLKD
ncbi:hypothetical protein C0989_011413 [Termitomyces sp. Mn162]|nr:hypothetical protein C0989_011413 [Termitomyces sp. Mn162]